MVTICEKCVGVILGPWDPETEPKKKITAPSSAAGTAGFSTRGGLLLCL